MNSAVNAIRSGSAPPSAGRYRDEAAKWEAVLNRDEAADGNFFYAVSTTGVYCRPSCAARTARRSNVTFHRTLAEAERAGFRACKRCRPDLPPRAEREAALVTEACRSIESAKEPPRLADLAARAGLSAFHFHRVFKRVAGVTPKAYAEATRRDRMQKRLPTGSSVTESLYDAGFSSTARFYESAAETLGMKPSAYRRGGEGEDVRYAVRRCSLGRVLVAATERGLCAILLGDDPEELLAELTARLPKATMRASDPSFEDWVDEAVRFVDDPARPEGLGLPLDIRGTAFQRRVWQALRQIPAGRTASYADVARSLGRPGAVRAVAGACAANTLAVAIPCHRVVKSDGRLSGYRWGVERKQRLLEREQDSDRTGS